MAPWRAYAPAPPAAIRVTALASAGALTGALAVLAGGAAAATAVCAPASDYGAELAAIAEAVRAPAAREPFDLLGAEAAETFLPLAQVLAEAATAAETQVGAGGCGAADLLALHRHPIFAARRRRPAAL